MSPGGLLRRPRLRGGAGRSKLRGMSRLALLLLAPLVLGATAGAQARPKRPKGQPGAGAPPAAPRAPQATDSAPSASPEDVQRRLAELRQRAADDFQVADQDGSGWLSFRETEAALRMTREDFLAADENQDGRLGPAEFVRRQMTLLERGGATFSPSLPQKTDPDTGAVTLLEYPPPPPPKAGVPGPEDLLRLFDRDGSGGLDQAEVEGMLADLGIGLSANVLVQRLDPNGSGALELAELGPLVNLVGPRLPEELRPEAGEGWLAHRVYGTAVPRGSLEGNATGPPRIPGPVPLFRRLDLFDDGFVDADDLRELASPLRLPLRPLVVLGALDLDGDGRLSPAELRAALDPSPGS